MGFPNGLIIDEMVNGYSMGLLSQWPSQLYQWLFNGVWSSMINQWDNQWLFNGVSLFNGHLIWIIPIIPMDD